MVINLVLISLLLVRLHCEGVGEIQFVKYQDVTKCDDNGCDFYFYPLKIKDGDGRILFEISRTKVEFEPISIDIPTNKSAKIVAKVSDYNSYNSYDEIRDITDFLVPFETASSGEDWKQISKTIDGKAQFAVTYRMTSCAANFTGAGCNYCEADHFTERCNVVCVPVPGNYSCNRNTGEKECQEGKKGGNCDECINGKIGPNCDQCKGNFAGDGCDRCAPDYYPEGRCEVHCTPDEGKYTCSPGGDVVCVRHRQGEECQECKPYYHTDNCTVFCRSNEFYNCTEKGEKVCFDKNAILENDCEKDEEEEEEEKDIEEEEEMDGKDAEEAAGNTGHMNTDINTDKTTPRSYRRVMMISAGGAAIIAISIVVAVVCLRKRGKQVKANEIEASPDFLYSKINRQPDELPLYSSVEKRNVSAGVECDVYSHLDRSGDKKKPQLAPRGGDEKGDVYSQLERPGDKKKPQLAPSGGDKEGDVYAKVEFVGSRDVLAKFENRLGEGGGSSSYVTIHM